ncbi:MAG: ribosome-associated translation inhibitor RaiA [Brevinematales bacterium]|jgi:putative sigma-54 modulation protein
MVVTYTGKNVEINDEMKDYLEKKLQKLKFYYKQIMNINTLVNLQRGKYLTELKVSANKDIYFAKDSGSTWQESFDIVVDKIEKEIKKKKDKLTDHHG